jgi:hypothetical protein
VLWSTEAIPAYLTGLLIPLAAVCGRLLCVPRHIQEGSEKDRLLVPAECDQPLSTGVCGMSYAAL